MKKRGKRISFSKKADVTHEVYFTIIQVLIALFILFTLLRYVDSIGDDSLFEKIHLSKDLALVTNIIYAAPGDVLYTYSNEKIDLSKYAFNLENQKVTVNGINEGEELSKSHAYGEDLNYASKNLKLSNEEDFVISNINDEFSLEYSQASNLDENE